MEKDQDALFVKSLAAKTGCYNNKIGLFEEEENEQTDMQVEEDVADEKSWGWRWSATIAFQLGT